MVDLPPTDRFLYDVRWNHATVFGGRRRALVAKCKTGRVAEEQKGLEQIPSWISAAQNHVLLGMKNSNAVGILRGCAIRGGMRKGIVVDCGRHKAYLFNRETEVD